MYGLLVRAVVYVTDVDTVEVRGAAPVDTPSHWRPWPLGPQREADMDGAYVVIALLGLLAAVLVWWVIAGELRERRRARAAAQFGGYVKPSGPGRHR